MINLIQFSSAIGCSPLLSAAYHEAFISALTEFKIGNSIQIAQFLAQVGHESDSLNNLEENLNYSAQRLMQVWPKRFPTIEKAHYYEHSPERLANEVYANRFGNGNYESGDGYRYHGRGPLQITFLDNYRRCGKALNLDLVNTPSILLTNTIEGARSACWFWVLHGCQNDAHDTEATTRRINGGINGLEDRKKRFDHALEVLNA